MDSKLTHVVIALIVRDGRLCVGQRLRDPFKGFFECPGGKVEAGESLVEGLNRELYEEGTIRLNGWAYLTHYRVENRHGAFLLHWFKVETNDYFAKVIYEDLRWVSPDELLELNWIEHNRPYLPLILKAFDLPEKDYDFTWDPTRQDALRLAMETCFRDPGTYKKKVRLHTGPWDLGEADAGFKHFLDLYPVEVLP